ncbi:SAM-dependent methyltransferase [Streptomyces niveus]|uniref:SAM-dependent methyltransferase n=1 Tax=Streptomyces niveus TaxID=193462 RepID=UPI00084C3285|nr:SAM-dependent methyltransferase [Streptomyces niveus]
MSGAHKPQVDTSKAHPARVYDWLLGGKDNYAVDRIVGKQLPLVARRSARQNRAFMQRAAKWLAGQGVDQFLDIGTGIPTSPNLHQVVQRAVPSARVVYVDNDPIVLRHAEALLVSTRAGRTQYVEADVRRPDMILEHARDSLDFGRRVAVSLIALLHFIGDEDDPYGIVRTFVDALAPGSFLVLSHGTFDFEPDGARTIAAPYERGGITVSARTRAEVERFFEGLDLVEPGLVIAPRWRKDNRRPSEARSAVYAGVAAVRAS